MMDAISNKDLGWILGQARKDTESLRHKKIFITGGTGFIGSWLTEYLCYANDVLQLNLTIKVLSRNPDIFYTRYPHMKSKSCLTVQTGDVRHLSWSGISYDMVIHAATDASAQLNNENPLLMVSTIVDGTRNVLEFARLAKATHVLMMSSGAVYGKLPGNIEKVAEDYSGAPDPLDSYFTYAESKRLAEMCCAIYARQYHMAIPVARLFAFMGPRLPMDAHFAAGNFLRDAIAGGPIRIAGDGTAVRSYMYAAELIVWLLAVAVRGQSSRAYNIGSDQPVSISVLANRIAAAVGGGVSVHVAGTKDASNPVNHYVPDVGRAKNELGLELSLPLDESIARTVSSLQRHRHCPLCSDVAATHIYTMNFELPATSPLPRHYVISSCNRCGMVYADSNACQLDYDNYYAQFSKYEDIKTSQGGGYSELDKQRLDVVAELLSRYARREDKILDIGCANGGMLDALRSKGFTQLAGVDPSPASIEHIKGRGFTGFAQKISELSVDTTGKFNVIILSHVLEHVFDVAQTMEIMRSILADDGLLYIEVPDAARYVSHPAVPYYYFDSEHINHFSASMLEKLAQIHGFAVMDMATKELAVAGAYRYPAVYALLKKHPAITKSLPLQFDNSLVASMQAYLKQCSENDCLKKIIRYADSGEPIIIWGAGSYTQRLLASTRLAECNIAAIVDNDSNKSGLLLNNISVEKTAAIRHKSGTILIASALHANEIMAEIHAMQLPHAVEILG